MTAKGAYMEGVLFAAEAWGDPEVREAGAMPDEASQRQFNRGYLDATLTLLCGRMGLDTALLKPRQPRRTEESASERRAA